MARRIIDLQDDSEGSSQDSYDSAQDSPGSLRDFIVDDSSSSSESDYSSESDEEWISDTEWEPELYCRRCKKALHQGPS